MELYIKDCPIEDEKGSGGLWDLAGEIALAVAFSRDGITNDAAYAEEWGQDAIYDKLCLAVNPIEQSVIFADNGDMIEARLKIENLEHELAAERTLRRGYEELCEKQQPQLADLSGKLIAEREARQIADEARAIAERALLNAGIILPKFKIGQEVWYIASGNYEKGNVGYIKFGDIVEYSILTNSIYFHRKESEVYSSELEALSALKEIK
jgi:hypothetical protein